MIINILFLFCLSLSTCLEISEAGLHLPSVPAGHAARPQTFLFSDVIKCPGGTIFELRLREK